MFRKIVSNLPFNPSLLGELSFYYNRLKKEEQVRRFGVVLVALSLFIQMFAVISPPEPTLASSDNDIIRGGFQTRSQAVQHCQNNTQGFARILAHFNVSCSAVNNADIVTLKSTDYNRGLDSMGRKAQGQTVARTGKPTNEYPVTVSKTKFYMRNLWAFDSGSYSTYKMLRVKNSEGKTIFIMYNCGNIVTVGKYTPPPPPPPPPPPEPKQKDVCPNKDGIQTKESQCDVCPIKPKVQRYESQCDVCPKTDGMQRNYDECDVCPNIPGTQVSQNECYPCPEADEATDTEACLVLDKKATNVTQAIEDADNTTAAASDSIVYTISAKNTGKVGITDFIFEEDMTDVLQYADIVDADGAELNDDKVLVWKPVNVAANETVSKDIEIKVKDTIPTTPVSASDPSAYDLVMNNTFYGRSINIKLPPPPVKRVETVTTTLPKTGPGESLLAASLIAVVVGYFLARTHLLRKETMLIRHEYATTGGN